MDRLVLREGVRARLADSVETALRWGKSQLVVLHQAAGADEDWNETPYSTDYRDPQTGFTLPALTAKHFSFNSHFGACPVCHGLGVLLELDPELMVPDPHKTLAEGAVSPWHRGVGKKNANLLSGCSCAVWLHRTTRHWTNRSRICRPRSGTRFFTARATSRSKSAWARKRRAKRASLSRPRSKSLSMG